MDWIHSVGVKAQVCKLDRYVYLSTYSRSKNTGVVNSRFPEILLQTIKNTHGCLIIIADPFIVKNEEIAIKMKKLPIDWCILDGHLPDLINTWYKSHWKVLYGEVNDELSRWMLCICLRQIFNIPYNIKRYKIIPAYEFENTNEPVLCGYDEEEN